MLHAITQLAPIATAIAAIVGSGAAVFGVVKSIPFFKAQSELSRQLQKVTVERDEARDAARAFELSSNGWQAAVEQLGSQVQDQAQQINSLTNHVKSLSENLGAAIVYIVECADADRHDKPMPPPPAVLAPLLEKAYEHYRTQEKS